MNAVPSNILLPSHALHAIKLLEAAGFEAWCVGGFVRDALRGAGGNDIDIASNAPWPQAAKAFRDAGCAVHETGTAFGTITALVDGIPIEVTAFRSDGPYTDARHPETVRFVTSIDEDLARRDFTVNAMAFHPQRGLRDPFGGQTDLSRGVIRAVGMAQQRFAEDALRILRAVRFSSQLGFPIEAGTLAGMRAHAPLLKKVAAERIRVELEKAITGADACRALLAYADIVGAVLPEVDAMNGCPQQTPFHIYDVLGHTARVVQASPATSLSRWAALFHDAGKPTCRRTDEWGRDHFKGHAQAGAHIAHQALTRLKAPSALRDDVSLLVRFHEHYADDNDASVLRMLRKLDGRVDLYRALLALQVADSSAKAPGVTERLESARKTSRRLEQLVAQGRPFTLQQLAVNGADLMAHGWVQGPELGAALNSLLDAVIAGELENRRDTLLSHALMHKPE